MTPIFRKRPFRLLCALSVMLGLSQGISAQSENGVNLSLWSKVSTQKDPTQGSTLLNLGIVSNMHQLRGVGINLFGGTAQTDSKGLQIAGLYNIVKGNYAGIQVAGIANVNAGGLTGLDASLLMNIIGEDSRAVAIGGLANIVSRDFRGLLMSGLVTVAGDGFKGIALTGLGNLTNGTQTGINVSGLINVVGNHSQGLLVSGIGNIATGSYSGISVGGLANLSGGDFRGLQASLLCNDVMGTLKGAQVGAVNIATKGKGLQLGLFNYYLEEFDGLQLGLINAHPGTRTEVAVSAATNNMLNLGLRFKNSWSYTILSLGVNNYKMHGMDLGFNYRAGIWYPVYRDLSLSGDLGIGHTDNFTKKAGRTNRIYSLQARLNAEYELSSLFTGFISGGYQRSNDYHGHCFDKGLFGEIGLYVNISGN